MKIVLVTTTINVPHVLALYRSMRGDISFFVAADHKTPIAAIEFCLGLKNVVFLSAENQKQWKCSEWIGWNTICRRNIAVLAALKWGAEIIVTIDDDNLPVSNGDYFNDIFYSIRLPFNGMRAVAASNWVDINQLLIPTCEHRGFPYAKRAPLSFEPVVDAKVGVVAGICLGDPDIGAVERIAKAPLAHAVSEPLRTGIVVDPRSAWTVFNTQNTAFRRDLAPAMLLCPQFGRYDDIVASLICQRIMRETRQVVKFGPPFVWQQRNKHNLISDLKAEMWGMENITAVADVLDHQFISDCKSVDDMVFKLYSAVVTQVPGLALSDLDLVDAWLKDCREAMA